MVTSHDQSILQIKMAKGSYHQNSFFTSKLGYRPTKGW